MSNFDSAFIKAYGRQGAAHVTVDTLRGAAKREEPIVDQLPSSGQAPTLAELYGSATSAKPGGRRVDMRAKKPTVEAGEPPARPASGQGTAQSAAPRLAPHTIVDDEEVPRQKSARTGPLSAFRRAQQRLARLHVETEAELEDDIDQHLSPSTEPVHSASNAWNPANSATGANSGWSLPTDAVERPQAAFQIEQFIWPVVADQLTVQAKGGFDTLCEQLIAGSRQGRKLLAFAGSRAQVGTTTFLLALAPQLATHGLRVGIVDADIEHPELAHQLGILPQYTWQDVVQQNLPLGEGWVESSLDRVTLSALVKPIRKLDARLAAGMRELMDQTREAFDLTLVDLGQLHRAIDLGVLSAVRPDGVVMVVDLRQRARATTPEIDQTLRAHGIDWWGIAENFSA